MREPTPDYRLREPILVDVISIVRTVAVISKKDSLNLHARKNIIFNQNLSIVKIDGALFSLQCLYIEGNWHHFIVFIHHKFVP